MSATITANNGAGSVAVLSVLVPYDTTTQGRNVLHYLTGGGIAVSLIASDLRSGTYDALFDNEGDAWDCERLHRGATSLTLVDTSRPSVGMTYVVTDGVTVTLDEATQTTWVVSITYQQVDGSGLL